MPASYTKPAADVPAKDSKTSVVVQRRVTVDDPLERMSPGELVRMEFPVHVPNQNFAVISYLAPHTLPASKQCYAIRIYATCGTLDEADRMCKRAQEKGYVDFDLFVVDITQGFFPLPPAQDAEASEVMYPDQVLQDMVVRDQQNRVKNSKRVEDRADHAKGTGATVEGLFEQLVAETAARIAQEWKNSGEEGDFDALSVSVAHEYASGMAAKLKAVGEE
jgi:hypothetical protein